ncbi:MAG: hypothetical protein BroJett011_61800 [Chloroflexota bacterium]|nr:MAG: hypothetical protein BroJett011_61800 [Chloroflexota bacterium]
MNQLISGLVLLVVGFSMGQMSAQLVTVNPWTLSLFVAGLGLALGYLSRRPQKS